MSFVGRIIAGARELPFGGPLGALLERAARHIPGWQPHDGQDGRGSRPAQPHRLYDRGDRARRQDGQGRRGGHPRRGRRVSAKSFRCRRARRNMSGWSSTLPASSTAGFESYARQVGRLFAADRAVLEDLLGGLFHIALADGRGMRRRGRLSARGRAAFRLRAARLCCGSARITCGTSRTAAARTRYAILGSRPWRLGRPRSATAYHRLVRESHPDLVIAQGLPPECIALATARVARINAAYDRLAKSGVRPG